MTCAEARPLIEQGRETPELLEHVATCAACRARNEATEFVRLPDKDPRAARSSARVSSHHDNTFVPRPRRKKGSNAVPFVVGGVALLAIVVGGVVLLMRARSIATRVVEAPEHASAASMDESAKDPVGAPSADGTHRLSVDSDPPGTVFIDGRKRGPTPYVTGGVSGKLRVEVRAPGYAPAARTVVIDGSDESLHLTLQRAKAGASAPVADGAHPADDMGIAPTGMGYLTIRATPYAHVELDGKDLHRSTPIIKLSVPVGRHHVVLRTDKHESDFDVSIVKGKEAALSKTFD